MAMAPNQTPARPGQELHCGEAGAHRMSEVKPSGFNMIHHESSWFICEAQHAEVCIMFYTLRGGFMPFPSLLSTLV